MDLEMIKTVLMVARLKSFSAAAYTIPCAQSSVSRRVDAVETELHTKIFSRPHMGGSRNVELTEAGLKLIPLLAKVEQAYTDLFDAAYSADSAYRITLHLGIRRNLFAPMALSMMLAEFFQAHPCTSIATKTDDFSSLLVDLRTRRLDAILFSCGSLDSKRFTLQADEHLTLLGMSALSIGISCDDPLSSRSYCTFEDLKHTCLLLNDNPADETAGIAFSNRHVLRSLCLNAGYEPRIRIVPDNMLEIRYKMAMDGAGVFPSYTPKAWRQMESLRYIPVRCSDARSLFYLLWTDGRKKRELETFGRFFSSHLDIPASLEGGASAP